MCAFFGPKWRPKTAVSFNVISRTTFKHPATQTRAGAAFAGVEDHEALQARATLCELTDTIEHEVDGFSFMV